MTIIWLLLTLGLAALALKLKQAVENSTRPSTAPPSSKGVSPESYYAKKSILTPTEQAFLASLETLFDGQTQIYAKVRLADIFGVKKGIGGSDWQRAFNLIAQKHVDFLLTHKGLGTPYLGIELDDSSHEKEKRQSRDIFVESTFKSAGLPLLRVKVSRTYDLLQLKQEIESLISSID